LELGLRFGLRFGARFDLRFGLRLGAAGPSRRRRSAETTSEVAASRLRRGVSLISAVDAVALGGYRSAARRPGGSGALA